MKRLASLLLVGLAGNVQAAGLEGMMNSLGALNPAGMGNPFAPSPFGSSPFSSGPFNSGPFGGNPFAPSPFGLGSPLGFGNPLGIGNPFGLGSPLGLGGAALPLGLGLLNPLGGGGMGNAMYPAMQMTPNMMSYQHMNQMANPYAGGPFAGNPYLQRSMPNPFSAPAFSPSMPSMPTMPFALPQQQGGVGGFMPMPQQQVPYYMPYQMPAGPQPGASTTPWSSSPPAPQPAQQPGGVFMPFMMPSGAAPAPSASPPQGLSPFFPMVPQASPAPVQAQAKPATAEGKMPPTGQPAPNSPPLDPAAFMQMFMKPADPPK